MGGAQDLVVPKSLDNQTIEAGNLLLDYATKPYSGPFNQIELDLIDQAFVQGSGSGHFDSFIIKAIRAALTQKRKNFELVQTLLRKRSSESLLKHDPDVLCLVVSDLNQYWDRDHNDDRGILTNIIESMIECGAKINHRDVQGRTALFHCCYNGLAKAYRTLLDAGAEFMTLHELTISEKTQQIAETTNLAQGELTQLKTFNLLQIALLLWLKGQTYGTADFAWRDPIDQHWGTIIMDLLEKGLTVDNNNPVFIKFFYIAAIQGQTEFVKLLHSYGAPFQGITARSDDREPFLGSALQAAAGGGQEHIVRFLLDNGADPKALTTYGGSTCGDPREPTLYTIVDAALRFKTNFYLSHTVEQLQACMVLVETNPNPFDGLLLLKSCIAARHMGLTKKLFDMGFSIDRYPIEGQWNRTGDEDFELIELLERYNIPLNNEVLQTQAAEKGQLKLLWSLVNSAGPQIPRNKLFSVVCSAIQPGKLAILKFLVLEYGLDVNEVFPGYNETSQRNIMWLAAESKNVEALQFVFEQGGDATCPGLEQPILSKLKDSYKGRVGLAREEVVVIRLLAEAQHPHLSSEQKSVTDLRTLLQISNNIISDETANDQSDNEQDKKPYVTFYGPLSASDVDDGASRRYAHLLQNETKPCKYEALQGLKPIRLVVLEPAEDDSHPLSCRLYAVEVLQAGPFEFLSYCDAVQRSDQKTVQLNDKTVSISPSLYGALIHLRYTDRDRTLWIEELCIDRSSDHDKTQQRRLASDILTASEQTICWLGESTRGTDDLFHYLQNWKPGPRKNQWTMRQHPELIGDRKLTFRALLRRPWFWSTWRLTEYAWSNKLIFMCGNSIANWDKIDAAASSWSSGQNGIWHSIVGVHENYWWRNLDQLKKSKTAYSVFKVAALTQTQDPRDRVFAIQSIINLPNVQIDYTLDIRQVYQNFTQEIIRESKDLSVLHWLGSSGKSQCGLPSWVPDYSISRPVGVLPRCFGHWTCSGRFPMNLLPEFRVTDDGLYAKGKRISCIKAVGKDLAISQDYLKNMQQLQEVVQDWETFAANNLPTSKWQGIIERFLRLISAGEHPNMNWYQTNCSGQLGRLDPGTLRQHDDQIAAEEWANTYKVDRSSYFADCIGSACPGRRFVILEDGSMGLANPEVREGDQLIFLAGGRYPFIVRPGIDETFELIGDCLLSELDEVGLFDKEEIPLEEFCLQ